MRTQSGNGKKAGKHQAELRLLVWQADREQKHGILQRLNIMWHSTIKGEYVVFSQFPGSSGHLQADSTEGQK
jgi:hypothetical protein